MLGTDKRKPKFELYVGSRDNANSTTNALSQTVSPPTPRKIPSTTGTGVSNHSTATGSSNGPSPGAGNVDSLRRQTTSVQSKVRERLIGLLTASGMQVGIPKSASFIFSQSTSDLYHEGLGGNATTNNNCGTLQGAASNSAYSSSERISHLDDLEAMSGSSLAAGGNEPSIGTDSFPRVFKEFDFLEAEHDSISESTESGFNWLSTIRPPRGIRNSRSGENGDDNLGDDFINPGEGEDDEEEDDIDETTDRGDLDIRSNANHRGHRDDRTLKKRHRRPLSGASESNDISSDRTPVQSEKHSDDSCPSCPNSDEEDDDMDDDEDDDELEEMDEFKSQKSQRGASSLEDTASITCPVGEDPLSTNLDTASSIQCRSEFSIQNASDYGARKAPIYLECNHHSSGQVEQVWLSLVNSNGADNDGEMTAHCILFFSQLFRECCVKMSGLLRDASLIMTSSLSTSSSFSQSPNNQRDVSGYFTHALDVLTKAADCPFLFITAQFLRSTDLLQTQKYKLYELGGHYETFIERREQCIRVCFLPLFSILF
uniref:Protein furry C-terminal domain-containing protein n=1 Tax=Panagrolaimus superbus TaxID=310955 RepID=A0A914Z8A2_9BILA